jgi:formate--tetrahydrofolate ligase
MCAWMRNSINPTLMSTIEGQPCMVHTGPFANIAVGQSSIIADRLGLKMFDYHVTDSGFGTDIGFEKFWNVKCRLSGLTPSVSVLTVTIRALKTHGGGPPVVPGRPLAEEYRRENLDLVEKGLPNLMHHLATVKKSGVPVVVCINAFETDTPAEIDLVRRRVEQGGAPCVLSRHWREGGDGALDLADAVLDACREEVNFRYLYPQEMPLRQRVDVIAREVYGAAGVEWTTEAEAKARYLEADPAVSDFATVMVKTHLSLSPDPNLKGVPKDWVLPVHDILVSSGAKFLCPITGAINLMPGTGSDPAFRRIDVDVLPGHVTGVF